MGHGCDMREIQCSVAKFVVAFRWPSFFNMVEFSSTFSIDGFSRRIIFLQCSSNNLSNTVLSLFLDAIETDGGLWPSRIRVDKGVENVLVCDAMVEARGEG